MIMMMAPSLHCLGDGFTLPTHLNGMEVALPKGSVEEDELLGWSCPVPDKKMSSRPLSTIRVGPILWRARLTASSVKGMANSA